MLFFLKKISLDFYQSASSAKKERQSVAYVELNNNLLEFSAESVHDLNQNLQMIKIRQEGISPKETLRHILQPALLNKYHILATAISEGHQTNQACCHSWLCRLRT